MISGLVQQSRHRLRRWVLDPRVQRCGRLALYAVAGFCLSAASLEQGALPLVMGLVWACRGAAAVLAAAGGCLGYGLFWGQAGQQGLWWTGLSLTGVLLLGDRRITREVPLLVPSLGMLIPSAVGLGFQIWAGDTTAISLYLMRVALGGAAPWLFWKVRQQQDPISKWICGGLVSLALAQIAPVSWLGLGFMAVGAAGVGSAFPCAALVGLGVDLSGVSAVSMIAVAVLSWLVCLFSKIPRHIRGLAPGIIGILLMRISGTWDLAVLPGLFLGGMLGAFLPVMGKRDTYRGETGAAQVHLEMAAGVLAQTQQILLETETAAVDTDALLRRAAECACSGCAARSSCRDAAKLRQLSGDLLQKPLLRLEELPIRCKKSGRFLNQLHNAQEQLRSIRADRQRQQEYRAAVVQQYGFLSRYLQDLSDTLARKETYRELTYTPVVQIYGNRRQADNADRCLHFSGSRGKYYIILCDGMGKGLGAVQAGKHAAELLQKMLCCGFPAVYALRSLNSLCALGERAGVVTVDMAEICLYSKQVTLYKWGAAASYLVSRRGAEKLGEITAPPGISVDGAGEDRCHLTLRREQMLVLVSDGLEAGKVLQICRGTSWLTAGGLAKELLGNATGEDQDDATVVTVQLIPAKS